MSDERVIKSARFNYFGQKLLVDIGSNGSIRFKIGDSNVQLSESEFKSLMRLYCQDAAN
jgi:hypothetical protein